MRPVHLQQRMARIQRPASESRRSCRGHRAHASRLPIRSRDSPSRSRRSDGSGNPRIGIEAQCTRIRRLHLTQTPVSGSRMAIILFHSHQPFSQRRLGFIGCRTTSIGRSLTLSFKLYIGPVSPPYEGRPNCFQDHSCPFRNPPRANLAFPPTVVYHVHRPVRLSSRHPFYPVPFVILSRSPMRRPYGDGFFRP